MKNITLVLIAAFVSLQAIAGKGIIVQQKMTGQGTLGAQVEATWYVSDEGCKMKLKFASDKVNTTTTFIADVANAELLAYSEGALPEGAKKSYFAVPVSKIETPKEFTASRVTVTKTGEVKEVAGFKCEKIVMKTNQTETEMWVTKEVKVEFYRYIAFFRSSYELLALNEEKIKGFPISSVTRDLNGAVVSSFETISAKASDISATEFKVPADFERAVNQ